MVESGCQPRALCGQHALFTGYLVILRAICTLPSCAGIYLGRKRDRLNLEISSAQPLSHRLFLPFDGARIGCTAVHLHTVVDWVSTCTLSFILLVA